MKQSLLFVTIFLLFNTKAQCLVSPFNKVPINKLQSSNEEYSFYLAGHTYGNPAGGSPLPASSFLTNLGKINSDNQAKMMVLLGDIQGYSHLYAYQIFQKVVSTKLNMPIFNARGNHDGSNHYTQKYGNQKIP